MIFNIKKFSSFLVIVGLILISSVASEPNNVRMRRKAGLVSQPRVGRLDPSMAVYNSLENVYPLDYEEYEDSPYKTDFKQMSQLAAYQQEMEKRTGANPSSGLWFGPRLVLETTN